MSQSEATNNKMHSKWNDALDLKGQTNRKRKTEQTTIYKTLHRKLKIQQHEPDKNRDELRYCWVNIYQVYLVSKDTDINPKKQIKVTVNADEIIVMI
jgi:hypothetical protein